MHEEIYHKAFLEIINNTDAGRILDVGTQTGEYFEFFLQAFADFSEAIGVDVNQKALDDGKEKTEKLACYTWMRPI